LPEKAVFGFLFATYMLVYNFGVKYSILIITFMVTAILLYDLSFIICHNLNDVATGLHCHVVMAPLS